MAMGILRKQGLTEIKDAPSGSRFKIVLLTTKGRKARENYHKLVGQIGKRWQSRFGADTIRQLQISLTKLVGDGTAERSPLFRGLEPYPDNWRAKVPKLRILPHYPMVLHRGGFPDGS